MKVDLELSAGARYIPLLRSVDGDVVLENCYIDIYDIFFSFLWALIEPV